MFRKPVIALCAAVVFGTAGTAFAVEGRDGDNNFLWGNRTVAQRGTPSLNGSNVFAGPAFAANRQGRRFVVPDHWDRCLWSMGASCIH
jgi:hypothetical protein